MPCYQNDDVGSWEGSYYAYEWEGAGGSHKWLGAIRYIGRPCFVCNSCGRNAFKVFCRNSSFVCYRCSGGIYASQCGTGLPEPNYKPAGYAQL